MSSQRRSSQSGRPNSELKRPAEHSPPLRFIFTSAFRYPASSAASAIISAHQQAATGSAPEPSAKSISLNSGQAKFSTSFMIGGDNDIVEICSITAAGAGIDPCQILSSETSSPTSTPVIGITSPRTTSPRSSGNTGIKSAAAAPPRYFIAGPASSPSSFSQDIPVPVAPRHSARRQACWGGIRSQVKGQTPRFTFEHRPQSRSSARPYAHLYQNTYFINGGRIYRDLSPSRS